MTMKMPMEVSKLIEQALPRVAGCCVPDSSQLVYHKNLGRIYLPRPLYTGCDLFFYVTTGTIGASPVKRAPSRLIPFPPFSTIAYGLFYSPH